MSSAAQASEGRSADWRLWRFELTAYGKYVELSFEDVVLGTVTDVTRWARELATAFEHYRRPVDLLLDLRGVQVGSECRGAFAAALARVVDQHAAAASVYGADEPTTAVLRTHDELVAPVGAHDRAQALEWLMASREGRSTALTPQGAHASAGELRPRAWERSSATTSG